MPPIRLVFLTNSAYGIFFSLTKDGDKRIGRASEVVKVEAEMSNKIQDVKPKNMFVFEIILSSQTD